MKVFNPKKPAIDIPRTKVKQEEKAYTPRSQLRTELLNQLQLSFTATELETYDKRAVVL